MTQINLLPWREKKREQEKKWFTSMLGGGVLLAAGIVFLMYLYVNSLVDNQTERNNLLQKEIAVLDKQIIEIKALKQVREGLISRMLIIKNLQATRTLLVHLFDELIKITPDGLYVYKLERKNDVITLWGYSESNTAISILMRNIENDVWLQNPLLTEIKKIDDSKEAANSEFSLSFSFKPLK